MSSPCFVDFIHSRSDLPIAVRARHGRAVRRRRIQERAGERKNVRRTVRVFERRYIARKRSYATRRLKVDRRYFHKRNAERNSYRFIGR